jgi:hypothetical protein
MVDVVDVESQEIFAAEKRISEVPAANPYPNSRPRTVIFRVYNIKKY